MAAGSSCGTSLWRHRGVRQRAGGLCHLGIYGARDRVRQQAGAHWEAAVCASQQWKEGLDSSCIRHSRTAGAYDSQVWNKKWRTGRLLGMLFGTGHHGTRG